MENGKKIKEGKVNRCLRQMITQSNGTPHALPTSRHQSAPAWSPNIPSSARSPLFPSTPLNGGHRALEMSFSSLFSSSDSIIFQWPAIFRWHFQCFHAFPSSFDGGYGTEWEFAFLSFCSSSRWSSSSSFKLAKDWRCPSWRARTSNTLCLRRGTRDSPNRNRLFISLLSFFYDWGVLHMSVTTLGLI